MQAVMCTLVIPGITKDLRYNCLLYFNANVVFPVKNKTLDVKQK